MDANYGCNWVPALLSGIYRLIKKSICLKTLKIAYIVLIVLGTLFTIATTFLFYIYFDVSIYNRCGIDIGDQRCPEHKICCSDGGGLCKDRCSGRAYGGNYNGNGGPIPPEYNITVAQSQCAKQYHLRVYGITNMVICYVNAILFFIPWKGKTKTPGGHYLPIPRILGNLLAAASTFWSIVTLVNVSNSMHVEGICYLLSSTIRQMVYYGIILHVVSHALYATILYPVSIVATYIHGTNFYETPLFCCGSRHRSTQLPPPKLATVN